MVLGAFMCAELATIWFLYWLVIHYSLY